MMFFTKLWRLLYINLVLVRRGLDEIVLTIHFFRPLHFVFYLLPWNWFGKKQQPLAARIRLALEDLGPVFIKFGQALSTRPDLLPPALIAELEKLQDKVPAFASDIAQHKVEQTLGMPVDKLFKRFDRPPLASASIAQVHAAQLNSGEEVVVKILRPNVKKIIQRDIALLYMMARLAERYWSEGRRLRVVEVVQEYEKTVLDELDLLREAANASHLRRSFENSELLYVPRVYWQYCQREVIVMERIYGVPISDIDTLKRHNTNLKRLAEMGVEIFFTQVFSHNFFHADMHPGNIFVSIENPDQPRYLGVDFGIVGTLEPEDQRYLAENFLAFFNHDYRRIAELHIESGWVPATVRLDEFEAAIRTVCEPIFQQPLDQISFGALLLRLFQTARRFNMEVQPQLILLQKTLLNVEGLGRQLYPELDLWDTAKPFLEQWMMQRKNPLVLFRKFLHQLPSFIERSLEFMDQAGRPPPSDEENKTLRRELANLKQELRWWQIAVLVVFGAAAAGLLFWL